MVPLPYRWLFRSRWIALVWAAGIIAFAVDVAGPADGGNSTEAANVSDAARLIADF